MPEAVREVRMSPKVPMSVRGLPDMVGRLRDLSRLGHALDPRLDLGDPVAQLATDMDRSRPSSRGAEVVDRLRCDAEVLGELTRGQHLLEAGGGVFVSHTDQVRATSR